MKIPNGAKVHTMPLDAMDSAVPLMYPPPTVVAGNEQCYSKIESLAECNKRLGMTELSITLNK